MTILISRSWPIRFSAAAFALVVAVPGAAGAGEPAPAKPDGTVAGTLDPEIKQQEVSTVLVGRQWLTPLEGAKFAATRPEEIAPGGASVRKRDDVITVGPVVGLPILTAEEWEKLRLSSTGGDGIPKAADPGKPDVRTQSADRSQELTAEERAKAEAGNVTPGGDGAVIPSSDVEAPLPGAFVPPPGALTPSSGTTEPDSTKAERGRL